MTKRDIRTLMLATWLVIVTAILILAIGGIGGFYVAAMVTFQMLFLVGIARHGYKWRNK